MRRLSILCLTLLFAVLWGCEKKPGTSSGTQTTATTVITTTTAPPPGGFSVVNNERKQEFTEGGRVLVSFQYAVPALTGENAENINAYYERRASEALEYAGTVMLSQAREELSHEGAEFKPLYLEAFYEIARNDGAVFSVRREIFENTQYGVIKCENFVRASGAVLTMDELFSVGFSEYSEAIREKVLALMGEEGEDYGESLMMAFDYADFLLTPEGIEFVWQPYSLSSRRPEARVYAVSYGEFESILRQTWIKR